MSNKAASTSTAFGLRVGTSSVGVPLAALAVAMLAIPAFAADAIPAPPTSPATLRALAKTMQEARDSFRQAAAAKQTADRGWLHRVSDLATRVCDIGNGLSHWAESLPLEATTPYYNCLSTTDSAWTNACYLK